MKNNEIKNRLNTRNEKIIRTLSVLPSERHESIFTRALEAGMMIFIGVLIARENLSSEPFNYEKIGITPIFSLLESLSINISYYPASFYFVGPSGYDKFSIIVHILNYHCFIVPIYTSHDSYMPCCTSELLIYDDCSWFWSTSHRDSCFFGISIPLISISSKGSGLTRFGSVRE